MTNLELNKSFKNTEENLKNAYIKFIELDKSIKDTSKIKIDFEISCCINNLSRNLKEYVGNRNR